MLSTAAAAASEQAHLQSCYSHDNGHASAAL
jgi:hypothetical protein